MNNESAYNRLRGLPSTEWQAMKEAWSHYRAEFTRDPVLREKRIDAHNARYHRCPSQCRESE